MRRLFLLGALLFMSVSVMAETLNLMVFGDSLSAGYRLESQDSFWGQLEAALKKAGYPIQVLNYSKSGETTVGGLTRAKEAIFKNPDGVLLELGINDALQNFPIEKSKQNLQELISFFQKKGVPVFLIGMEAPINMDTTYRDAFRKMYDDLAFENELLLYPFFMQGLWNEDGTPKSEKYFLDDHFHPSAKGVSVMVNQILPAVEQFIQEDMADVQVAEDK